MPPRILAVDDDQDITFVIATALRSAGFEAVETNDPLVGLELVRTGAAFDLVVLDVMMPGMDGFEVCRHLRECGFSVPLLFLTARDASGDRSRALDQGADDYLTKPFEVEELVARVRSVLHHAGPPAGN